MLYQSPLPEPYPDLSQEDLIERIQQAKKILGKELVILTHHYQRPEVVKLGDVRGDSLKLAQYAANQTDAKYIVYCGVHFMAESADILKKGDQMVILPDLGAGCDMADMAEADDVEDAWKELCEVLGDEDVMPVTYVNSTAALKAFVAQKGGVVCTSSNAENVVNWAFSKRKRLFFYPDQHLGRNTCKKIGIPLEQMKVWNPKKTLGDLSPEDLLSTKVFLWQGHCPVHMMFTHKQIEKLRQTDPTIKIISHPECPMEVVDASDFAGSTEFIVKKINESPAGSSWAVGTELHLVTRLAQENPDKKVVSLNPFMCLCGTMNRIDLPHLAWSIDMILQNHIQNIITVSEPTKSLAREALERMLSLSN